MSHLRNILVLSSTLFLAACWMGDKFTEIVPCPSSKDAASYAVSLTSTYCPAPLPEDLPTHSGYLNIPKERAPVCTAEYPVPNGTPITGVSMVTKYPGLAPAKRRFSGGLKDGQVAIHITPRCRPTPAENHGEEQSQRFLTYVKNNEGYKDDNGKPHFAPIQDLGGGWYFQKNIREPYMDGNASLYFYKNNQGAIEFLLACDDTQMCYADNNITNNEKYQASYRFMNIPHTEFIKLHREIEALLLSMQGK